MHRIKALAIALVLMGGLAACSDDDDGGGGSNPPPSSTGTPPADGTGGGGGGEAGGGGGGTTGQGSGGTGDGGTGDGGTGDGGTGDGTGGTGGGGVIPSGGGTGGIGGGTDGGTGGGTVTPLPTGGGGTGTGGSGSSAAQNITPAPAANAEIAMDAAGNAIAVWEQSSNIYYSRYSGGAWSAPALLEALDTPASQPQIAMNNAGNAMAVWVQPQDGGANYTWGRYFENGTWQAVTVISDEPFSPFDAPFSDYPSVAIDDSGTALATWREMSIRAPAIGLVGNAFHPGSGWEGDTVLAGGYNSRASLAMNGSGSGIAAFGHDGGHAEDAHVVHYTAGAGWGSPIKLRSASSSDAYVSAAMNASGEAIVVWSHNDFFRPAPSTDVVVSRYVGGTWTAPQRIETNDSSNSINTDVALADNGNATVAWQQDDAGVNNIYAARLEGGTWLQPTLVGEGVEPQVAAPANGPVIAWLRGGDVMFSHYNGSNAWQAPQNVESNAEAAQGVRLASSSHANAFALWRQPNGVWARLLP